MAKKKTTKFKVYPQTYQFGGMPFLDQYQKLGKQWDTFWRGGNYFSPGNVPPTGVYADPNAMLYNTVGNNNAATTAYTNNKQTLKDNSYTGEWGAQAHNDYYNKTLGNQYTPSQLTAFAGFEKAGLTGNTDNTAYNNWYTGRQAYANQAGAQFDSERLKRNNALAEQPGVEKQMGDAFANTFSGVTTGLNYINSYVPPEQINLVKGSKGVMYGQHGANVNLTGYTPNTPTMDNPMNEIPGGDITTENTPIPILTIGKGGAHNGFLQVHEANSKVPHKYNKVKSTVEIPLEQQTQQQMTPIARYGKQLPYAQSGLNIAAMLSGAAGQVPNLQNQQANYLNTISGGDYINATPEFNQKMLAGFNQQQVPQAVPQIGMMVPNNGLFPQQAAYTQPLPGVPTPNGRPTGSIPGQIRKEILSNSKNVLSKQGDPYEYKSVNGEWQTRRRGTNTWKKVTDPTMTSEIDNYFLNQDGLEMGEYKLSKVKSTPRKSTASNIIKAAGNTLTGSSRAGINPAYLPASGSASVGPSYQNTSNIAQSINLNDLYNSYPTTGSQPMLPVNNEQQSSYQLQVTDNNPTNNSNYAAPISYFNQKGAAYTQVPDAIALSNANTMNFSALPIGYGAGIVGKGIVNLPKIGKVIQYGSKYIDKAGNYISKSGNKLGKAPKAVIDATKDFFKMGSKPNVYDDILLGKVNKAGKYIDPITKKFTSAPIDSRGGLQKIIQDSNFSTSFKNTLNSVASTGKKLSQKAYKALTPAEKNAYDSIAKKAVAEALDASRFANAANITPGVRTAWGPIPKQYGGYIPSFQFGGSVNDEHSTPIFSSNLEDFSLTELQTEKGEIAFMPDGSIVDVKAKELHKKQDKHNVSDIMQSGTYVFSNDPKMKFGIKSKIGGVELGDMKLGKSVFKYKENEISPGPEDIMLKDMFFNGSKKELTTADIAKNVKKNLPIVDLKNDYFADRSIAENKDQRKEYLSVLKAFNEYKKPKSRSIPKAQYGMPIQPTQNGLDGVMGYGDKQADPFKRMDNNMISIWNIPQPKLPNIPRMYNDGGNVPQAQFGWLADGIDAIGGWSNRAKREQERKNEILRQEAQGYRDNLQSGVDRAGALGVGTNMATYAASLNVPLQRYDDQSEQMSMYNAAANRAVQRLEASKYTASQGIGGASTLARYSNPTNYGDYLAKTQSQSDTNIGKLNQAIADLDMQRANANIGFTSARNAGRNQSLNARDTQVYNANVQGIGNVGRSAQEATFNSADTRYRMGNEKMAYDAYLTDKALAAKQAKQQQIRGYTNEIGQLGLTYATGGFGGDNLFAKDKTTGGQPSYNFNSNPSSFGFQNNNQQFQQSPANGLFQDSYGSSPTYNTIVPGGTRNPPIWGYNPATGLWGFN